MPNPESWLCWKAGCSDELPVRFGGGWAETYTKMVQRAALPPYVDSLFVQRAGTQERMDFEPLLKAIYAQTKIPIALDGIYRWVCFLPSKRDKRIPVPNRYFGVFQSGEVKYRGIAARRRDTPYWVKKLQLQVLDCLSQARTLDEVDLYSPKAQGLIQKAWQDLRNGNIPPEELVITQSLSREVEQYKTPSHAARAARQLLAMGKTVTPGQFMRFVFVRGKERVRAWELGVDPRTVDVEMYRLLMERATDEIISMLVQDVLLNL